ncbi:hypothetical protein PENTCL1PPCAC_20559, partial [Pristionchus entomophagus]
LISEAFRKILIPDIFSIFEGKTKGRDRLNLQLCSREVEEAVASSDMLIDGYPQMSILHISGGSGVFKVHLGLKNSRRTLKLKKRVDQVDFAEL